MVFATPKKGNMTATSRSEILAECLQAIERGQATLESCVANYREFEDLQYLLQAATVVKKLPRTAMPAVAKDALGQQMLAQFRARQSVKAVPVRRQPSRLLRFSFPLAAVFILLFA